MLKPDDKLECVLRFKLVIAITTEEIYQFGASVSYQHTEEDTIFEWNSITEEKKNTLTHQSTSELNQLKLISTLSSNKNFQKKKFGCKIIP